MKDVMDFLMAALPWIGIGLFAAINIVKKNMERSDEDNKVSFKKLSLASLAPFACFVFVAAMEFKEGDTNSGTVWMCLAIINFVFFRFNHQKGVMEEDQEEAK